MSQFTYKVTEKDKGLPIKDLVRTKFSFSSRLLSKLKRQELILCDGKSIPLWIVPPEGSVITIFLPHEKSDFEPENIPISVVYEDEHILIIDKQPGIVVHPTKGKPCHTLANGLMNKMINEGKNYKIRFVNRLDMNTSGLLIVAKNSHSQDELTRQMKLGQVAKRYKAIVVNPPSEDEGTIDKPIGRPDPEEVERWILDESAGGYPSVTHYKILERFVKYGLIELSLETGRTHQIRVHLSSIGSPILGDHLYSHGDPFEYRKKHGELRVEIVSNLIGRQALHAFYLSFLHPVSGERMEFSSPLPADIASAIDKIKLL